MKTWTKISLNLTQIQDFAMTNMWLHGYDGGMLQPSPLKEISPWDLEQWGDTKEVACASLRGKKPWILRTKKFLGFPYGLLPRMVAPLNFEESNCWLGPADLESSLGAPDKIGRHQGVRRHQQRHPRKASNTSLAGWCGTHYCHTWFLCQNQVLIVCMTQDQLFHTYGQKCSQITNCHE
jgi:hypothetical protein